MRPTQTEELIFWLTDWPDRADWHREYLDILLLPEIAPEDCNTFDPDVWSL